jgi:hypothetical protein
VHFHLAVLARGTPDDDRGSLAAKRLPRIVEVSVRRLTRAERNDAAAAARSPPHAAAVDHLDNAAGNRRQFNADSRSHTIPAVFFGS